MVIVKRKRRIPSESTDPKNSLMRIAGIGSPSALLPAVLPAKYSGTEEALFNFAFQFGRVKN